MEGFCVITCPGVPRDTPRVAAAGPYVHAHTQRAEHKCELNFSTLEKVTECTLPTTPGQQTWHTFHLLTLLSPLQGPVT